jgi:hypothetical protein
MFFALNSNAFLHLFEKLVISTKEDIIETEETIKVIGRHEGHQSKQRFSITIPTPLHKGGRRVATLNVAFLEARLSQTPFLVWWPKVRWLRLHHRCPLHLWTRGLTITTIIWGRPGVFSSINRRDNWSQRLLSWSANVVGRGS